MNMRTSATVTPARRLWSLIKTLVLAGLILITGAVLVRGLGRWAFSHRLDERAGAGAIDCGTVMRADDPREVLDCVEQAMSSRHSFRAAFRARGTDSMVFHGLVSNADGNIVRVTWDSHLLVPTWSVTEAPCPAPHFDFDTSRGILIRLRCE